MDAPDELEPLLTAYRLKDEERTGWVLRGVTRPESVADHSWGTALLCLLFAAREGVDADRAVRIALVHDLAESITGDVAARANAAAQGVSREEKARREDEAMGRLGAGLARTAPDGPDVRALWQEYEDSATPAARFVRDMNLVDMVLQAVVYEEGRRYDPERNRAAFPDFERLDEFFATSRPRLSTRTGRALHAAVEARYRAARGPA
jgi:putative hydrolases of HD superfamily